MPRTKCQLVWLVGKRVRKRVGFTGNKDLLWTCTTKKNGLISRSDRKTIARGTRHASSIHSNGHSGKKIDAHSEMTMVEVCGTYSTLYLPWP